MLFLALAYMGRLLWTSHSSVTPGFRAYYIRNRLDHLSCPVATLLLGFAQKFPLNQLRPYFLLMSFRFSRQLCLLKLNDFK